MLAELYLMCKDSITDVGCKSISKAKWSLVNLKLDSAGITVEGVKSLVKGKWPNMKLL